MTGLLRSLAVVGGLLLGLALPASASADYATTVSAVNLRAGAGVGFARLATIPGGASVWVEFCQPLWCKVIWRKIGGWVSARYLDIGYEEPAPTYDDYYYYEYDYGFPYPYPWPYPHHHHKPPHCKPGHDCKPPKPWPKWNKPPKWDHETPQFDNPTDDGGGPPKRWKKEFDQGGAPNPGGRHIEKPSGGNLDFGNDNHRDRRGKKKWEDE